MTINRFPLNWPAGWPRATVRKNGQFGTAKAVDGHVWRTKSDLTMPEAMKRVAEELNRLGIVSDDFVVSTNLKLNLSGYPRGDQGEPFDPGVAVYFQKSGGPMRVIAIDRYRRVRDNLAAIAATLESMRAIDRHGGAQILERAFTGFDALPAPSDWREVLEIDSLVGVVGVLDRAAIDRAFRRLAAKYHPDVAGGSHDKMSELNAARARALEAIG